MRVTVPMAPTVWDQEQGANKHGTKNPQLFADPDFKGHLRWNALPTLQEEPFTNPREFTVGDFGPPAFLCLVCKSINVGAALKHTALAILPLQELRCASENPVSVVAKHEVRDALLAIFPNKTEEIHRHVDPGEHLGLIHYATSSPNIPVDAGW